STRGILWKNRHFLAVRVRAADPPRHRSGSRDRMSVANGEIGSLQVVGGELARQPLMRSIALGDDKQSRGILIDPMDDPGTGNAADAGQLPAARVQQRIAQGSIWFAGRGCTTIPAGLSTTIRSSSSNTTTSGMS